ncbi:hypothetical protein SH2C18_33450 [Clostridium sediminicola]
MLPYYCHYFLPPLVIINNNFQYYKNSINFTKYSLSEINAAYAKITLIVENLRFSVDTPCLIQGIYKRKITFL